MGKASILIDAQDVAGARTGIPRATYFDLFPLTQVFERICFLITKDKFTSFTESDEYRSLCKSILRESSKFCKFDIVPKRPNNTILWIGQLLQGALKTSGFNCDVNYNSLFPLIFKKETNVLRIVRLHDPFSASNRAWKELLRPGAKKHALARALRTRAFNLSLEGNTILVANSNHTKEKFKEIYNLQDSALEVIWPSVGFATERPLRYRKNHQRKYLLSVMGQRQRKDPLYVINAWAEVALELDLDFVNVGVIPLSGLSARAIQLMLLGRLKLENNISFLELKKLQEEAFASVFCSHGEGFGLPVAESLFSGIPVIHNNLPVLEEISGPLIPSFDMNSPKKFIEVLSKLSLEDSYYHRIKELSWSRGSMFTHEVASEKWRSIITKYSID